MRRLVGERGTTRRWWAWVLALTLVGFGVRLAYIAASNEIYRDTLPRGDVFETRVWGDGLVYHQQANLLVDGEGLITPIPFLLDGVRQESADHVPLYTLYLTAFSSVGVRSEIGHMVGTAVAGAATAVAFGLLGRKVGGPRVGMIAAVVGAFNPSIFYLPADLLSEAITIPLAALMLWSTYRVIEAPTVRRGLELGAMTGLGVLARAELATFVPLAIIPIVLFSRSLGRVPGLGRVTGPVPDPEGPSGPSFGQRFAVLAAAGATCALLVLPWVGYNLSRFEKPIYLSVGLDYSLVQGNCDEAYTTEYLGYYWLRCMNEAMEGQVADDGTPLYLADQSLGAAHLREVALDYIADHPKRAAEAVAARLGRVTGVFRPIQQARLTSFIDRIEPGVAYSGIVLYYPLAALAVAGAFGLRRRHIPVWPFVAVVATTLIAVAMTLAVLRYRTTTEPVLAVLAAVALVQIADWIRRAWQDQVDPSPPRPDDDPYRRTTPSSLATDAEPGAASPHGRTALPSSP